MVYCIADPSDYYNNNYSPIYSLNLANNGRRNNKNNLNNLIIRNSHSVSYDQQKSYKDKSYGDEYHDEDYDHKEGKGYGGPTYNYDTCIQNLSTNRRNQDIAILALLLGCNGIGNRG